MNAALCLVDVFTQQALRGNPVAVVIADATPSDAAMLALAAWTGMPETVFATPGDAEADYRVRIWSPRRELPFAGHPSIGTAHALLATGRVAPRAALPGRLVQASPFGPVTMRVDEGAHGRIWFRTPRAEVAMLDAPAAREVSAALGIAPEQAVSVACVEAGARWLVVHGERPDLLDRLAPDLPAIEALSARHRVSGVTVVTPARPARHDIAVRSFGPAIGVDEDAACGGGNACAAALIAALRGWRENGANAVATQGAYVGRDATLHWRGPDQERRLEIGGHAMLVSQGTLQL
ncbi:PhzF family phenazine biosynthesis isomerase [Burkholderia sp. Ac-20379]|uniref:PhzF family phenazine biosynthesis isomerase n=1 Tax=Burkholderia sp. Ac-20379 TaxID=2703900 RepID=UPI00197EE1EE|nr:PhzF family phenazine biosynthesis protein [Burkholderia sp. Ac-20379]